MATYNFTKSPVDMDSLTREIKASSIVTVLSYIEVYGTDLTIVFPTALSGGEQTTLNAVVAAHTGVSINTDMLEYSSTTNTSTNNANYSILNGMQSVPLMPGTYLVTFSGTFSTTIPILAVPAIYLACFYDGVKIDASEQGEASGLTGNLFSISLNCKITVADAKRIDVRWKNNGVLNTITNYTRVLNIAKWD